MQCVCSSIVGHKCHHLYTARTYSHTYTPKLVSIIQNQTQSPLLRPEQALEIAASVCLPVFLSESLILRACDSPGSVTLLCETLTPILCYICFSSPSDMLQLQNRERSIFSFYDPLSLFVSAAGRPLSKLCPVSSTQTRLKA